MTLVQSEPKAIKIWIPKSDYSAMQWPCDTGFHIPLQSEWQTIYNIWVDLWIWSSSNWDGMKTYLKIPFSWQRNRLTSSTQSQGSNGYYWFSDNSSGSSKSMNISSSVIQITDTSYLASGYTVRPIKDTPVTPDSSWTALYSDKIYHNSTLWLISIKNWDNWITIADKNVWATSTDTNSSDSYWYYFQRWNCYGFPTTWSVSTSSSTVNAWSYWPWNYYSSSTFVTVNWAWDNSNNYNLRWWETWAVLSADTDVKAVYLWTTKVRPPYKPRTFTITRTEQSNMSSWWAYSDDATWLTAGDGAFDDFFWYSAVLLNTSWTETAEMKQSWWVFPWAMSTLGNITSGDNVMIKFPVRWIKMTKSWSKVTLSITEELNKDWYQYYAFQQWQTNNITATKDKFYMWAYMWYLYSNKLLSWSWAQPTMSYTQANYITYAENNGTWYTIEWFYQREYIAALYMMKYGNPNYRATVWYWYAYMASYAQTVTTWWTNSQTNATYGNTSQTNVQAKLFGLEDRWGSRWEFIWWAYLWASKVLYTQLSGYSWAISWGVTTWATLVGDGNNPFISAIAWTNKAMFAPTSVVSSRSYYICETLTNTANRILCWWDYSRGLIGFYVWQTTDTNNNAWARLMYL